MLSEEDKREMLEDARDPQRKKDFTQARKHSLKPMTWQEYFQFLQSVQNIFPREQSSKIIQGNIFKL